MDLETKEKIIPPVGFVFNLNGFLFRVSYRNPGKLRCSIEPLAALVEKDGVKSFILCDGSDRVMSDEQFKEYITDIYPTAVGPKLVSPKGGNVTLDIHPGGLVAKGGLS